MTNDNTNAIKNLDLNQALNDFLIGLLKQSMERLMQEELTNVLQYENIVMMVTEQVIPETVLL